MMTYREFDQLRTGAMNHALTLGMSNELAEKLDSVSVYFPDFVSGFIQCLGFVASDNVGEALFRCQGDFANVDVWGEIRDTLSSEDCYRIVSECVDFVIQSDLDNDEDSDHRETVYSQAGHDFCLTRNGHGAGFWDGDWKEPFASKATKISESFGEIELRREEGEYFLS